MTNSDTDTENLLLDFESVAEADISLTPEQIDRAIELSNSIINPQQQWQTYLNALALFGFTSWLEERDSSIQVNSANCSVTQPQYANYIDGVFNLTVGEFKVCLLTNGVAVDELITSPRAVLELPEYAAHFYILVNVIEERGQVAIDSFLRYDEIIDRQQTNNLTPNTDWTYDIPLTWFNSESDDLLLNLRCLNSQAIALPEVSPAFSLNINELETLIPQLQNGSTPLSEILTWTQGAQLLANPSLLTWLYELQTATFSSQAAISALRNRLSTTVESVTQRVINVKSWLSNELDEIAQNLAWTLLPQTAFAPAAMRDIQVVNRESPGEELTAILTQLRDSGEEIPNDAAGAYHDFDLASYALRVFVITWDIEETVDVPEWNLSIFLGGQPNSYLPQGLKLELKQDNNILDERIAAKDIDDTYLYVRVIGELEEEFNISIVLPSGDSITLPKFIYQ